MLNLGRAPSLSDPTGLFPNAANPKLPTVPTGKAGCQFFGEAHSGGPSKSCIYQCSGYGASVVFPQAVKKRLSEYRSRYGTRADEPNGFLQ